MALTVPPHDSWDCYSEHKAHTLSQHPASRLLILFYSVIPLFSFSFLLRRLTHCAVSRVDTEQFQGCCHGEIVEQKPGPQCHQHRWQTQLCSHSLLRQNLAVSVNTAYLSEISKWTISKLIHTTIFFTLLYQLNDNLSGTAICLWHT